MARHNAGSNNRNNTVGDSSSNGRNQNTSTSTSTSSTTGNGSSAGGNGEEGASSSARKRKATEGKENEVELWNALDRSNSSQQKEARNGSVMDDIVRESLWPCKKWIMREEELVEGGTAYKVIMFKLNGMKKKIRKLFWARYKGRVAHVLSKKRSSTTGMIKLKVFGK